MTEGRERERETRKMGKNTLQQLCNVWAHKRAAAHAHPHKMVLRQQSDKMLLFCFAFCSKFASETKRQEQKRNKKLIILRGTAKINEYVLIGVWKNNKQKIDKFNARLSKPMPVHCSHFKLRTSFNHFTVPLIENQFNRLDYFCVHLLCFVLLLCHLIVVC